MSSQIGEIITELLKRTIKINDRNLKYLTSMKGNLDTMANPEQKLGRTLPSHVESAKSP